MKHHRYNRDRERTPYRDRGDNTSKRGSDERHREAGNSHRNYEPHHSRQSQHRQRGYDGSGPSRVWLPKPKHQQDRYRQQSHFGYRKRSDFSWTQQAQIEKARQALNILDSLNNFQTNTLYKNASFTSLGVFNKTSTSTKNNAQPIENEKIGISENSEVDNKKSAPISNETAIEQQNIEDNHFTSVPEESREVNLTDQIQIKAEVNDSNLNQNNEDLVSQINETAPTVPESNIPTVGTDTVQKSQLPKLSIIPLALLLQEEQSDLVLEKHFEDLKKQFQSSSKNLVTNTAPEEHVEKIKESAEINVDCDTLSQKIVNRVMTMDRMGIKYVINNPDPKFDAALKLRARKRLREEIRKQLQQMNINTPSGGKNIANFEPDEFVQSGHIPETIINEIRKTFGMKFLEEAGIFTGKDQIEESDKEILPDVVEDTVHINQRIETTKDKELGDELEKPKTDLMTRLKNFETIKANHSKHVTKSPIKTEVIISKPVITEEIVSIDLSSSDNSDNTSSSDSDSDSSSSSSSSGSNYSSRRKEKKKKALEENVVNSFKTLILPYLTSAQRQCFEKKSSNGNLGSLLYIYDVCLSKMNKNNPIGVHEKKILKKNLKSSNNEEALQFLIKNIKDLFEQDKIRRRHLGIQKNETSKSESKTQQKKSSKNNQEILLSSDNEIQSSTKSLNEKHSHNKVDDTNSLNQRETDKVRIETKNANSAVGGNSNDILPYESSNPSSNISRSNLKKTPERELNSSMVSGNKITDSRPRSWKSPGEKKCLQPPLAEINQSSHETDLSNIVSQNIANNPLDLYSNSNDLSPSSVSNFTLRQTEDLRLLSLIQQNKLSEAVLNNLKEIDLKLMELHKRRMYIEEMILKLQKDKMVIDLTTMQLQNEKFLIISSSAAQSNLTVPLTSSQFAQNIKTEPSVSDNVRYNKKKKTNIQSRPPFSTPFSEKLRNRKKRCQRDILLEYTATSNVDQNLTDIIIHSSPEQISENVDDIFQRKKRKIVMKSKPSTSKNNLEKFEETEEISKEREDAQAVLTLTDSSIEDNFENEAILKNGNVPNGRFEDFKKPISQIRVCGDFIIAASEDGHVYKYSWKTKKLLSTFSKHRESVTQIYIDSDKFVYSTSLDGYMRKTSVENFGLEIQSVNVQEPLQTVDIQWDIAFIGSRWGNVFTYEIKKNKLSDSLLCSLDSSIMVLKAVKEGARKILIVSSKGSQIHIRDASSGLLLRTIEAPSNLTIYSILLHESTLFCGSSRNEIFAYDFGTGTRKATFLCGNGVVTMKLFRKKYIFAGCYDGFVYVLDKLTGSQIGRFPGCGKIILAMDIIGEKFVTSSKDGTMQFMDIPKYILALDK